MQDFKKAIKELIVDYGRNVVKQDSLSSYIEDLLANYPLYKNISINFVKEGILKELIKTNSLNEIELKNYVMQIVNKYGTQNSKTQETLLAWTEALSVRVVVKNQSSYTKSSNKSINQPKQNVKSEAKKNIKLHSGEPIPKDSDFFASPPKEIGEVVTAQSSLKKGEKPMRFYIRVLIGIISIVIGLIIGLVINHYAHLTPNNNWFYVWVIGFPLLGLLISFAGTSFIHTCTYVGKKGVAKFTLEKNRNNPLKAEILQFKDAESLYTETTEHYRNFTYDETTYSYKWKDKNEKTIYKIEGAYHQKKALPKDLSDNYYFALSAKESWNSYKLSQMIDTITNGDNVRFKVKNMTIEVGINTMNIYEKGKQLKWNISDIDSIGYGGGVITIYNSKHKNNSWFSKLLGKGELTFAYADMPNADLFLLLLENLLGKK